MANESSEDSMSAEKIERFLKQVRAHIKTSALIPSIESSLKKVEVSLRKRVNAAEFPVLIAVQIHR